MLRRCPRHHRIFNRTSPPASEVCLQPSALFFLREVKKRYDSVSPRPTPSQRAKPGQLHSSPSTKSTRGPPDTQQQQQAGAPSTVLAGAPPGAGEGAPSSPRTSAPILPPPPLPAAQSRFPRTQRPSRDKEDVKRSRKHKRKENARGHCQDLKKFRFHDDALC